jgi:hypothetical protein
VNSLSEPRSETDRNDVTARVPPRRGLAQTILALPEPGGRKLSRATTLRIRQVESSPRPALPSAVSETTAKWHARAADAEHTDAKKRPAAPGVSSDCVSRR